MTKEQEKRFFANLNYVAVIVATIFFTIFAITAYNREMWWELFLVIMGGVVCGVLFHPSVNGNGIDDEEGFDLYEDEE